jgi:hypothetical protein
MQSIEGVVTIVQEGRFQLLDDDGVGHLFLLSYSASAEPEQLGPLLRAQARVRVSYRPAADVIGHRAEQIMLMDKRERHRR